MSNIPPTENRLSTPAIISYAILALFGLTVLGVFLMAWAGIKIDPVMLGILGSVTTAVVGGFTGMQGFWLGSSQGAKTSAAVVAQLAGAGPPPPAAPGSADPAPLPEPAADEPVTDEPKP